MATDGGEVQVRLSVAGGDEVLVTLQRLREETEKLPQATEPAVNAFAKLAEQIRGFKDLAMLGQLGMIVTGVMEVARAVEEMTRKVVEAAKAMVNWVVSTIKARAEMEQFEIRLAAIHIKTMDWSAAMLGGIDTASKLEYMSARTVQSLGGLVSAFTQLQRLTMNTDQATLQLTEHLAVLGKIAGSSAEAVASTISRAALTGNLPTRSEVGRMLSTMGFTGQDIKEAYEAGRLFEYLESKMGDLGKAAEELRNSWQGIMGGLHTVSAQFKDTMGTIWEPLKAIFIGLRDIGESDGFKALVAGFASIAQGIVGEKVRDLLLAVIALKEILKSSPGTREAMAAGAATSSLLADIQLGFADEPLQAGPLGDRRKYETISRDAEIRAKLFKQWQDQWKTTGSKEFGEIEDTKKALDEMFKEADRAHTLAGLDGIAAALEKIKQKRDALMEAYDKRAGDKQWAGKDAARSRYFGEVTGAMEDEQARAVAAEAEKVWQNEWRAATRMTAQIEAEREKDLQIQQAYFHTLDEYAQASAWTELEIMQLSHQKQKDLLTRHLTDRTEMIRKSIPGATIDETTGMLGFGADFIGPLQPEVIEKVRQRNAELEVLRQQHSAALIALDEKQRLDEEIVRQKMEGDWDGYYEALRAKRVAYGDFTLKSAQDDAREAAQLAADNAETGADGIRAGLKVIQSEIKSFGQDTVEFMKTVWSQIGSTFDDTFLAIFTGKFSSIEDIFKNLFNSILQDWSKMLSQMLTRWLVTGDAMGNGQGTGGILGGLFGPSGRGKEGYYGPGTTQYGDYVGGGTTPKSMGLGDYAAYAAYAYGAYQGVSSIFTPHTTSSPTYQGQNLGQTADFGGPGGGAALGGAAVVASAALVASVASAAAVAAATAAATAAGATTAAAAAAGAAASSVVPVVGWIVAAALLVVSALMYIFASPQEGHIYVAIRDAFEKSGARSVIGEFVKTIMDTTGNYIVDLATVAGKESKAGEFVKAYQEQFKKIFGAAAFDIAAGSPEDLQKDVENFFKNVLPKFAMQAAFGQYGVGMPPGDRDWKGGLAGVDWNANNGMMDKDGNWIRQQLYDPTAPIPALLLGLDFTAERVAEIANKLATSADMDAFKKWLFDLIEVVVTMREFVTKLNWTPEQVMADITTTANKTPAQQFAERATTLASLAEQLQYYVGDEQIAKAKELNGLVSQYWADQLATIKSLMDMADQFHQLILDTTEAMDLALTKLNVVHGGANATDWAVGDALSRLFGPGKSYGSTIAPGPGVGTSVYGMFGAIEAEADPVKAATMAKEAIALINQVFSTLLQRLQEIYDLQAQNDQLLRAYNQNAIEMMYAPGQPGVLGTGTTTGDMAFMLGKAQATSGQEQLNWIARLQNAAAARYEEELRAIAEIQRSVKELARSVESQKWGMQYEMAGIADENNPLGHVQQGGMLMERIKKLMGDIGSARSPDELNRITGEIQGLAGQYWQMSDKSQGAFDFVSKILDAMQEAADKRFDELFNQVISDNEAIYAMLKTAGGLLTEAEKTVKKALDDLRESVEALDTLFKTKFKHTIDEIIEANGGLATALAAAIPFFTKAATELGGEDNKDSVARTSRRAADSLGAFQRAVDAATVALGGEPPAAEAP